ncbi:hypothetical protein TKK_0003316 [Trichogramma kaykai]
MVVCGNKGRSPCSESLAQRFCRSLIERPDDCLKKRHEYRDITALVLKQLGAQQGYDPHCEDRRSQQMRVIAESLAYFVVNLMQKLAESRGDELEADCQRRRKELEERAAKLAAQEAAKKEAADESSDERSESEDEPLSDVEDSGDIMDKLKELCAGVPRDDDDQCIKPKDTCDPDGPGGENCPDGQEGDGAGDDGAGVCNIPGADDQCFKQDDGAGACAKKTEECQAAPPAEPIDCQTDEGNCLCEEIEKAKPSDLPFLTFGKIIEALFCALEREPPVMPGQPEVDRLHRAIYEKFEDILDGEKKDILKQDSKLRDLLNVATGKIAVWLSRKLDSQTKRALAQHPAEVESKEIRHWSQDIVRQADVAENWCNWIEQVAREAAELKRPQRGEYCRWTGGVQKTCMRYRKAYLETLHEQHHNDMMLRGREVVKTGEKRPPPPELGETFVGCSTPDDDDSGCKKEC